MIILDPDPTAQVISDPDPTGQVITDPDFERLKVSAPWRIRIRSAVLTRGEVPVHFF